MGELARIRYAVVGLGNIAQVAVLPAFAHAKENSELVALVSSDDEKLRRLARQYGVKHTGSYDELERVLAESRANAVYVAVPNALHRTIAERAARAGVHVLCEKPLAPTVRDCEAMLRAAQDNDVQLMVAYRLHFEETNMRAVERIRKGEIGDPRIFSSIFSHQVRDGDIRTRGDLDGGALLDMGIYCINAARYLFQAEPVEVLAQRVTATDERFRDVDEMTSAILTFPEQRIAQLTASQGAADVSELRVVGTRGDLRLDPAYEYAGSLTETVTIDGHPKTRTVPKHDQFAPELVYFSRCILEGRTPEPSAEEGIADVRIVEAILESARTGTKVALLPSERTTRPDIAMAMRKPAVRKIHAFHAPSPSK